MLEQIPQDGGPIYAETDLSAFIAEPWNAISSLAILLPAVYWAFRLKGDFKTYSFIYFCVPFLFFGGLGSTLFHAFRSSGWFLLMDVLPTAILTLSVSIYLWIKILPKWWFVFFTVVPLFTLRFVIYEHLPPPASINTSYFLTGTLIFVPLIIELIKTSYRGLFDISLSVLFLGLSLLFRERDFAMTQWLPMGSHFLWHLFSGVGAFFLAQYLYKLRRFELETSQSL